ncbi:MAG: bifunctional aldolase/short-chain dehydrogenase [Saprospiraceae bacterium]
MSNQSAFKHVSYLWDEAKAASFGNDQVALFIYRSNLLGADLRLTNYGGGNTSVKIIDKDPLNGEQVPVMWIKGSGGDIGTLKKSGCAALYMDRLLALDKVYRGIDHEDEMVALFNHCIYDLESKAPSIDTPLHAFLPFLHIDHLHPDAAIAIAAAKDGKQITHDLFGGKVGWVEWQRPGFDLGLKLRDCLNENKAKGIQLKGIMLGSHGLFTWGDTSYESYINTLEVIEQCAVYLEKNTGKSRPVFGGMKIKSIEKSVRRNQVVQIAPILRGLCSSHRHMIGHFTDDDRVMEFINSNDLDRLAPMGTSCPDHFLRTKISPLVLPLSTDEDLSNAKNITDKLSVAFEDYRKMYSQYYDTCKHVNSPAMRDPNPVVILYPGIGMFTFAKDKTTARLASEYYINAINVMKGAEAVSAYTSLPRQEAFNIEYWLLEEAKLQRMPKPKALSGKIALITGSAGGIGKAIANKFAEEGACILLNDINPERLEEAEKEFKARFGKDVVASTILNVTDIDSIKSAFQDVIMAFGGVDIIINNAGISISKSIGDHTIEDWDKLYDILVKGQFLVSQQGIEILKKQNTGGDIINIVSKNAVVAGPNNAAYGSAKSAQGHLSRLMAAELGSDKIRVNMINPDAVIAGSNIWSGGWAEGRAKAYGVSIEELPAYYAKRTLLNEIILPEDIANAAFVFVGGLLNKTTGNALNVDGGISMGFYR